MTFLPVVERELRVASRRSQTYWRRAYAAMIALALFGWVWIVSGQAVPQHARAQGLFYTLAGFTFIYSLLAGAGVTSDAISEEKREGTLGLLFLTDLKGFDVVAGKLAAKSLDSFYRLVAVLPLLAIPLLMGGVPAGEFLRMALVLVNTLAFSLAAGIFVSSVSSSSQRAASAAFALVLVITVGPALIYAVGQRWDLPLAKSDAMLWCSPAYGFTLVFDAAFKLKPADFWRCAAVTHALTWLFLITASLLVPRIWQDRPAAGMAGGWSARLRRWRFGEAGERDRFRTRLLDINPFFWLAARERRKPQYPLALVALGGLFWLLLYVRDSQEMLDPAVFMITAFGTHLVLKLWVGIEASRQIAEDRRTGALELLLSTPLTVGEILRGHRMALHRQFMPAVVVALVADLLMLAAGTGGLQTSEGYSALFLLSNAVIFMADLYALAWLGMWFGLTSKSASRASARALFRVLFLPAIIYLGLLTFIVTTSQMWITGSETLPLWLWIFVALLTDISFLLFARQRLHERLRTVATERFDTGKSAAASDAPAAH